MRDASRSIRSREAGGSHFHLISPREAIERWPYFLYRLARVLDRTDMEYGPDDILTGIQYGRMQLWQAARYDAIAVTQVQHFPRYTQFLVYALAGKDAKEWLEHGSHDLDRVAKSLGCQYVAFHGRLGWMRMAKPLGFEQQFVVMRKRI